MFWKCILNPDWKLLSLKVQTLESWECHCDQKPNITIDLLAQVIHRIITITILVLSLKWQKSNSVAQSKPDQDLPHARADRRANVIWSPHHWWPHRASERCYAIWGMFGSQTTSWTIASTELPRSQFNLNFKFGFLGPRGPLRVPMSVHPSTKFLF